MKFVVGYYHPKTEAADRGQRIGAKTLWRLSGLHPRDPPKSMATEGLRAEAQTVASVLPATTAPAPGPENIQGPQDSNPDASVQTSNETEPGSPLFLLFSMTGWSRNLIPRFIGEMPVLGTFVYAELFGFFGFIGHSFGLDGSGLNSGFDDELLYGLGWSGRLLGLNLSLSVSFADVFPLGEVGRQFDNLVSRFTVGKYFQTGELGSVTPFVYTEYWYTFDREVNPNPHSFIVSLGAKQEIRILRQLVVRQGIELQYDNGNPVERLILGYFYAKVSLGLFSNSVWLDLLQIKARVPIVNLDEFETITPAAVLGAGVTFFL